MLIALDYDGTYTASPWLWRRFISDAKEGGHEVVCVTMRFDSDAERIPDMDARVFGRVIYTGRKAKHQFLSDMGISPQIWIDDNPQWIYADAI
jgi:hypothetical protein